jgi:PAS domain S-box-containing protein
LLEPAASEGVRTVAEPIHAAIPAGDQPDALTALHALVDVSADGLALLDDDGGFTRLNASACRLLGRSAAELVGRPAPFAPVPGGGPPSDVVWSVRWSAPDGRRRDFEYRLAPLPGGGHAVWFSDVTDFWRQQERLTAIARAASSVAEAGSLPVTLDAVAREMVMTANIAAVQILSLDDPAAELRVLGMAGFGAAPDFVERLSACRRLGAHVRFLDAFRSGEPVVMAHRRAAIMADPAWRPLHEIMGRPDWDGFVSIPMVVRGRAVGVINAYYEPGEDPNSHSLAFLEAMADHAAVAVDTASLLSQVRAQAESGERRRLARDLHDSVVQQLFSMRMQAKALRSQLDRGGADAAKVRRSAEELAELAASALADLRQLVFELRPLELAERGLVEAVCALAVAVQARTGLRIHVRVPEDVRIDGGVDVHEDLYRIVSEAVHNVVKHACATEVEIILAIEAAELVVEVADDGAGAATGAADSHDRLGLVSMRERAQRWGGRFAAGPRPGGGWVVRVQVPLSRFTGEPLR